MISHLKGKWGEDKACDFLLKKKYIILQRNYKRSFGEVDIIAKREQFICFIEVKTWDNLPLEDLHFSINQAKVRRMKRLAQLYLLENPQLKKFSIRFDLIFLSRRMKKLDFFADFI